MPKDVTCQEAFDRIYEYLDKELTPTDEATIKAHLSSCTDCFKHFGFEEAFLRFLRARREVQKAPESLRRKILEHIVLDGCSDE